MSKKTATISFVVLLLLVAIGEGDARWQTITAKWSQRPSDGFFNIPITKKAAVKEGWTPISGGNFNRDVELLGYYDDFRVGLLFAKSSGKFVGFQFAIPVGDIKKAGVDIDYRNNPAVIVKTLNNVECYTGIIFVSLDEEKITLQGKDVVMAIPTETDKLLKETPFLLKKCVKTMGIHYYQIDGQTKPNEINPTFLLSHDGKKISGVGFQAVGPKTSGKKRMWWESISLSTLRELLPDAPFWLGMAAWRHGIISLHVYFGIDPRTITCRT